MPQQYMPANFTPQTSSLCMIVKNEAEILARCLKSAAGIADQIIIVDTGSTDDTVKIAESFGATVIHSPWQSDFAQARNVSIKQATGAWIIWLDADDIVPASSIPLIKQLVAKPADTVYGFVVRNEKPSQTGSEFVQARMFPNHPQIYFERRIHEQVMLSAMRLGLKLMPTDVVVEHHGYADPATMKVKAKRNADLLLQEYQASPGDPVLAVEIADSYTILDEQDNASKWYQTVIELPGALSHHPMIASQAYLGLGTIANRNKEYSNAIRFFEKAIQYGQSRPDALFGFAIALEFADRIADSIEQLQKILQQPQRAIQVSVDFRQTRIKTVLRLERLLWEAGRISESDSIVARAFDEFSTRPEILNMAGAHYVRQGKIGEALKIFEKSLAARTEGNIEAYAGLCYIYRIAQREDLVEQTLDTMKKLFEDEVRFLVFRKLLKPEFEIPTKIPVDTKESEAKILIKMFGLN